MSFTIGLDLVADPTGNTALSGYKFVRKGTGASDANTGGLADPFLTINYGLSQLGVGEKIVIGGGEYEENLIGKPSTYVYGDGMPVIKSDGTTSWGLFSTSAQEYSEFHNLIFDGFTNAIKLGDRNSDLKNCIINGGVVVHYGFHTGDGLFNQYNFYNNCSITISWQLTQFSDNIIIGGSFTNSTDAGRGLSRNNLFYNSSLNLNDPSKVSYSCLYNSPVTFSGTQYNTIAELQAVDNSYLVDCKSDDPQFLGNPTRFETLVSYTSPMLSAGYLNQNIGNVKAGLLLNENTAGFGSNPANSGNTDWLNGSLQLINGATESTRESQEIDLGRVIKSPFIRENGISDYVNDVADSNNTLVNHNYRTVMLQWAGRNHIYNGTWKPFLINKRMYIDSTGKSNGEAGFDPLSATEVNVKYLKAGVTLRNDRIEQ